MNRQNSKNATQMAVDLTGNPMVAETIREHKRNTRMVCALADTRVRKHISQKAVAERMGISISAVSRFEDSQDRNIRFGDMVDYANAVGMNISLLMEDSGLHTAARIKNCVFALAANLHKLSELATKSSDDKEIVEGIRRFRSEVLLNFLIRYNESGAQMPQFTYGGDEGKREKTDRATAELSNVPAQ